MGLFEEETFKPGAEGGRWHNVTTAGKRMFQAKATANAKVLKWESAQEFGATNGR